jgi:hypothetical protein
VPATDPFFDPESSPGWVRQRAEPVKHEAVFEVGRERLAVASTNLHHDAFGRAFGVAHAGRPAASACVAFGLERWLLALLTVHGRDPTRWPAIDATPLA